MVEGLNGAALENFLQEHFAKRGRQLINQTGNAEVVIADNGLFGVEYLADLKRNLGFLKGARKILDAVYNGADAHNAVGVELARKRVYNGAGKLIDVARVDVGANLLHERDVRLIDVDDEILVLVREQILHHVVRGNIGLVRHFDEHADAADIRVEAQLAALQINVAGQDVIEDNVFDEIAAVILFIVILLDAVQRNSQKADIFCGFRVVAGDEHCVFRARAAAEGFICVVAGNKCSLRCNVFRRYGFRYFADLAELAARDNHGGLVDDADRAVNGITHLMNDALKQSIGHDFLFSPSLQIQSCAVFDGSRTVIHSLCYLYYRIKTDFSSLFEYFF